jgi:hypothetical protein
MAAGFSSPSLYRSRAREHSPWYSTGWRRRGNEEGDRSSAIVQKVAEQFLDERVADEKTGRSQSREHAWHIDQAALSAAHGDTRATLKRALLGLPNRLPDNGEVMIVVFRREEQMIDEPHRLL